ncbi:MAG: DUF5662 family protein [Bacteroidia bacterium]|nr:DUF5662 family protein [Bacteroidia bacterium]
MTLIDAFENFCRQINFPQPSLLSSIFENRFFPALSSADIHDPIVIDFIQNTLLPHKIAVYHAGMETVLACNGEISPADIYQYVVHDLSKFSLEEREIYAYYFSDKNKAAAMKKVFPLAWHHHKTHNEHHPEHWLSVDRRGKVTPLPMPDRFVQEMVADWKGASLVYGGGMESWMVTNLPDMLLHEETKTRLNRVLEKLGYTVRC